MKQDEISSLQTITITHQTNTCLFGFNFIFCIIVEAFLLNLFNTYAMKNKPTIAVVQDDLVYRITTQKLLQNSTLFADVLAFENGLSAINYIQKHNNTEHLPDIILLDISMPVMDGWTFLKEYERLSPILSKCSSIYIHTASLFEEDLRRTEQYSCVAGNIPTPLRVNELQKQLELTLATN